MISSDFLFQNVIDYLNYFILPFLVVLKCLNCVFIDNLNNDCFLYLFSTSDDFVFIINIPQNNSFTDI